VTSALVVIESPGKKHTLGEVLRRYDPKTKWVVLATKGHLRDLPKKHLGVATDAGFTIQWVSKNPGFKTHLRKVLGDMDRVYLASDADREGEEIAAAVESFLPKKLSIPVQRLRIRAITEEGVRQAFLALNENDTIDRNLVAAQHARRALDRLFGYTLSPKCWRFLGPGMATGRVQACVLHALVEHAHDRLASHRAEEITEVHVPLQGTTVQAHAGPFEDPQDANKLLKHIAQNPTSPVLRTSTRVEAPPRPCTTASILRAAGAWKQDPGSAQRDLQALYERGLITYPRTDNAQITSQKFLTAAKAYVKAQDTKWWHGPHAPPKQGKIGTASSEAHEAVRPTALSIFPSHAKVKSLPPQQVRMYRHVWATTIGSLGHVAQCEETIAIWKTPHGQLHATFFRYTDRGYHDPSLGLFARGESVLPTELDLVLKDSQVETFEKPPIPHHTPAAVVKWMEKQGVGRPATYAATLDRLLWHKVIWKDTHVGTSARGVLLDQFLQDTLSKLLDPEFTARMERDLDRVALGSKSYEAIVGKHWEWLQRHLPVQAVMGPKCPGCSKPLRLKVTRSSAPFGYCGSCKKQHDLAWSKNHSAKLLPLQPKRYCPQCKASHKHTLRAVRGLVMSTCASCKTQHTVDRL